MEDALSRATQAELLQLAVSSIKSYLMTQISDSWKTDTNLAALIKDLQLNPSSHSSYSWSGEQLRRKGKLVVGNELPLKDKILSWMHDSSQGGHSGTTATL